MPSPTSQTPRHEQFSLDWSISGPRTSDPADSTLPAEISAPPTTPSPPAASPGLAVAGTCGSTPGRTDLVQILPWDFRFSFPEPLEEAITAGRLHEEDSEPENLKALHDEHARHALVILSDLDAVLDARRRGVDPNTGKSPRTEKQRERLEALFRDEPPRLEHAFNVLMDVYEEAFGGEAVDAFRKAIRAWHAGLDVIAERPPRVPPLPQSVRDGVFGTEEDGTPVDPGPEEIEAIAVAVAEKLLESPEKESQDQLLRKYAEEFGLADADQPADRAYAKMGTAEEKEFSYDPGHPWHYYPEGDNAEPVAFSEIPAANEHGFAATIKLPKEKARRYATLRQILADQEKQLEEDKRRYTDLIEKGVEALSEYDRHIAHGGNDDLAWASAVALKYNHIRHGRGRILWLRQRLA